MFSIVGCQIETIDLTHRQWNAVVLKLALLLYLAISTEPPALNSRLKYDLTSQSSFFNAAASQKGLENSNFHLANERSSIFPPASLCRGNDTITIWVVAADSV